MKENERVRKNALYIGNPYTIPTKKVGIKKDFFMKHAIG